MFKQNKRGCQRSGMQSLLSVDVARLSGVSLRQLQWWDEQKVVSPRHDGHKRIYDMAEVVEVA